MSVRVSRTSAVLAHGRRPAVVSRAARISRQAIYRPIYPPARSWSREGPPRWRRDRRGRQGEPDRRHPDGRRTRVPGAGGGGEPQTSSADHASPQLLQPARSLDRRRRPGFLRVTRPDELWHMEMTRVRAPGQPDVDRGSGRLSDISVGTMRRWIRQDDVDDGVKDGRTTAEQSELVHLRREKRRFEMENEILRRAAVRSGPRTPPVRLHSVRSPPMPGQAHGGSQRCGALHRCRGRRSRTCSLPYIESP